MFSDFFWEKKHLQIKKKIIFCLFFTFFDLFLACEWLETFPRKKKETVFFTKIVKKQNSHKMSEL